MHLWDIQSEKSVVFPKMHTEKIIAVQEIIFLKLIAASSVDHKLILWDP